MISIIYFCHQFQWRVENHQFVFQCFNSRAQSPFIIPEGANPKFKFSVVYTVYLQQQNSISETPNTIAAPIFMVLKKYVTQFKAVNVTCDNSSTDKWAS